MGPSAVVESSAGTTNALEESQTNTTDDPQDSDAHSLHDSPELSPTATHPDDASKPAVPIQKRRRVTRACDECRRKKIKCDGKQPCTHCTVYSYECTYDQPSNRRRNAAPQYVEALESQLKRANAILRLVVPNADLNDPELEMKLRSMTFSPSPMRSTPGAANGHSFTEEPAPIDDHIESMVKTTGQLDIDDQGHLEYHGHSSGLSFVKRMRESLGDVMGPEGKGTPFIKSRPMSQVFDSPRSLNDSPREQTWHVVDLPSRDVAMRLCDIAINDASALLRVVHYPTFLKQVDRLYDVPHEQYTNDDNTFLPLLYSVLALGTLFSKKGEDMEKYGYENAIDDGFKYFKESRRLMDIADCRDLRQLHAIIFMILFLQSSAKLSVCYAYIGVALRSALRLGLHRSFTESFSPIEAEERKRTFWVIRKMDTYVGALLGLPHALSDDDIDQEYPTEVDDECIHEDRIEPMPDGKVSIMAASNAHTSLIKILAKIVASIYPTKASNKSSPQGHPMKSYSVSYTKIWEIEQDLQQWQDRLPSGLKPGGDVDPILMRVQHLLRMAFAHAQMMLYRPFLHFVSQTKDAHLVDKRSYACAAACVSVSRNIVHIAVEMKKRGLLGGAYWFTMYTTFFAILSLVFYALENPENNASQDVLRVAQEGKETLDSLAKRSMAADRCSVTLRALFKQLPDSRLGRVGSVSRKRRKDASPNAGDLSLPLGIANLKQESVDTPTTPKRSIPIPPQQTSQDLNDMQYASSHGFFDINQSLSPTTPATPSMSNGFALSSEPSFAQDTPMNDNNFPLADLSAMMFPSTDPFAYPNQTAGNDQSYDNLLKDLSNSSSFPFPAQIEALRNQRMNGTPNGFVPPSSTFMFAQDQGPGGGGNETSLNSGESDVQLLGPMPMYMMQGTASYAPQPFANGAEPPQTSGGTKMPAAQANSGFGGNVNLDQLLGGEEWAGLPADRGVVGAGFLNQSADVKDGGGFVKRTAPGQNGGQPSVHFEDLTPGMLGWGLEGY